MTGITIDNSNKSAWEDLILLTSSQRLLDSFVFNPFFNYLDSKVIARIT